MNGPDGKPTKPDDDFEPLVPALEEWFEKEFAELPIELQERITHDRHAGMLAPLWDGTTPNRRRSMAQQRDCANDPANKDEREFGWDAEDRYSELERIERELKVVPAVGMAARNYEQRLIKAERIALKEDEREVRSAPPTELRATIERVRRRWDERLLRLAGLIAAVPENVAEKPTADTENRNTSKGGAPPRRDQVDFNHEVVRRLTLDGGDVSLTQIRNEMKQWASDHMKQPLDDRTGRTLD